MGKQFADQYSLLHFATGVISYFWGLGFVLSLILHTIFELTENTPEGIKFINTQLAGIWPGGKPAADNTLNIVGDTIAFGLGWIIADQLDKYGIRHGWY